MLVDGLNQAGQMDSAPLTTSRRLLTERAVSRPIAAGPPVRSTADIYLLAKGLGVAVTINDTVPGHKKPIRSMAETGCSGQPHARLAARRAVQTTLK